jgi:hypothetical protein
METPETWKGVVGFPCYEVSDHGRVRSLKKYRGIGNILKIEVTKAGYCRVTFQRRKKSTTQIRRSVHRIVFESFIGPIPEGMTVNHVDGRKSNNCVGNLELATPKRQIEHAYELGLRSYWTHARGSMRSKLSDSDVMAIRRSPARNAAIAKIYGMTRSNISLIRSGRTWAHLPL